MDYNNKLMKSIKSRGTSLKDRNVRNIHFVHFCEPEQGEVGQLVILGDIWGYYEGIRIIEDDIAFISQFNGSANFPITSIFHGIVSDNLKLFIGCANGNICKVYKEKGYFYQQKQRLRPQIITLYPGKQSIVAWNLNSEALIINESSMLCLKRIPFGRDITCIFALKIQKKHSACIGFKNKETPIILNFKSHEQAKAKIENMEKKAEEENSQMDLEVYLMSKNKGQNKIAACLNKKDNETFYLCIYQIEKEQDSYFCCLQMRIQLYNQPLYIQIYKNQVVIQQKSNDHMKSTIIDIMKRSYQLTIKDNKVIDNVMRILKIEENIERNEYKYIFLMVPIIGFIENDPKKKNNKVFICEIIKAKNHAEQIRFSENDF